MKIDDKFLEKHCGKFVIRHAGLLVVPERSGKKRVPFEYKSDAENWAKQNYRGFDWEVVGIDDLQMSGER